MSVVRIVEGLTSQIHVVALTLPIVLLGDKGDEAVGIGMWLGLLGLNKRAKLAWAYRPARLVQVNKVALEESAVKINEVRPHSSL